MKISLRIDINKVIEFELGWPRWIRRGHRTSVLVAGVAAAIFLVSTVYVIAHHLPFTDVPTSGPLHDAVGAIYGARITVGTSPTTYSPGDPVTREQMAFFLQRSLGRAGYSISSSDARLSEVPSELAAVTIKAGEIPGGVGFIKVDANYSVYSTNTTQCPCDGTFQLVLDSDNGGARIRGLTINPGDSNGDPKIGTITWVVPVSTGTSHTLHLKGSLGGPFFYVMLARGEMSAMYVPFGSQGDSNP